MINSLSFFENPSIYKIKFINKFRNWWCYLNVPKRSKFVWVVSCDVWTKESWHLFNYMEARKTHSTSNNISIFLFL